MSCSFHETRDVEVKIQGRSRERLSPVTTFSTRSSSSNNKRARENSRVGVTGPGGGKVGQIMEEWGIVE